MRQEDKTLLELLVLDTRMKWGDGVRSVLWWLHGKGRLERAPDCREGQDRSSEVGSQEIEPGTFPALLLEPIGDWAWPGQAGGQSQGESLWACLL